MSDDYDPKPHERFFAKVAMCPMSGCWLWTGSTAPNGYGKLKASRKVFWAHRWSYEQHVGRVPTGLELDHLCRVRACVNPAHLEPVTKMENALRGNGFAGKNARKTHCLRGHPLSGDNLYAQPRGGRRCRACGRAQIRAWYIANKAAE